MTCKINADTSNGLKIESDTSGIIELQSNGVTKVTFDTSGNMTTSGTLPAGQLTGNVASSLLSGALPAIDGSNLTGIVTGLTASAYTANTNGYITLSNGLIFQWGRQGSLSNGQTTSILFPITFPNAIFSFAAAWTVSTSGTHHSAFPDANIGTSSFGAHNVSGATNGVVYIACGR